MDVSSRTPFGAELEKIGNMREGYTATSPLQSVARGLGTMGSEYLTTMRRAFEDELEKIADGGFDIAGMKKYDKPGGIPSWPSASTKTKTPTVKPSSGDVVKKWKSGDPVPEGYKTTSSYWGGVTGLQRKSSGKPLFSSAGAAGPPPPKVHEAWKQGLTYGNLGYKGVDASDLPVNVPDLFKRATEAGWIEKGGYDWAQAPDKGNWGEMQNKWQQDVAKIHKAAEKAGPDEAMRVLGMRTNVPVSLKPRGTTTPRLTSTQLEQAAIRGATQPVFNTLLANEGARLGGRTALALATRGLPAATTAAIAESAPAWLRGLGTASRFLSRAFLPAWAATEAAIRAYPHAKKAVEAAPAYEATRRGYDPTGPGGGPGWNL